MLNKVARYYVYIYTDTRKYEIEYPADWLVIFRRETGLTFFCKRDVE